MTEKTPRQIGEEAAKLRTHHQVIEGNLENANRSIQNRIASAQTAHRKMKLAEQGLDEYGLSPDLYRSDKESALASLGHNVIRQVEAQDASQAHIEEAQQHYAENRAAYHASAIAESLLEGVHIDINQADGVEEAISVRVMPHQTK